MFGEWCEVLFWCCAVPLIAVILMAMVSGWYPANNALLKVIAAAGFMMFFAAMQEIEEWKEKGLKHDE